METTFSRHAPLVAGLATATIGLITVGLVGTRHRERTTRWALLNEAVGILRRSEQRARQALAAATAGRPLADPAWSGGVRADAEELQLFLRRSIVDPQIARWVEDAVSHLHSAAKIDSRDDDFEDDLTDWLVRLSAAREQLARLKRASRARVT